MITVTRLNHESIVVNADLIEYVETTPDTVISLTTGEKFMVLESPDEVVDLVVAYGRRLHGGPKMVELPREIADAVERAANA